MVVVILLYEVIKYYITKSYNFVHLIVENWFSTWWKHCIEILMTES